MNSGFAGTSAHLLSNIADLARLAVLALDLAKYLACNIADLAVLALNRKNSKEKLRKCKTKIFHARFKVNQHKMSILQINPTIGNMQP